MQGSRSTRRREGTARLEAIGRGLRRIIARAGWLFAAGPHFERGRLHREVMRLDVVTGGGHTPNSYGWHVDALLNVGMHYANDPVVPPVEPSDEGGGLPARVSEPSAYRVSRAMRHPQLRLGGAHS